MRPSHVFLLVLSLLLFIAGFTIVYFKMVASGRRKVVLAPPIARSKSTTTSATIKVPSHCPPGGVWSEWMTTGPCPTTCGSCSDAPRVRQCTKVCGDCPCDGPSVGFGPCGITPCPFPSALGTCCTPSVKTLNYRTSTFFCGSQNVTAITCAS